MAGEGVEEPSIARDLPFLSDDIGGLFSMSTPVPGSYRGRTMEEGTRQASQQGEG
jgi:hypothetical protein